ncbi:hypothetical protein COW36_03450 [bacterium (Candidatus Blackallbacteria) CG17_big_fil_post_rev_8_21_14_2_50_48_46]|uniref:Uncharacterized protein n=1 Tax=bacterium (Candidatus Blackallbacteria) CG17_big_fil_post_rev_8_21_14_2_50_48_46 TaxID=2014261 RepID=A0A2M7G9K1_9BACT|nr:MAG: hypothetical protein COW64_25870 [bacterium (Candidatus Blackallbacteria) CG18_big_fil_WC_8_21_14_2_50_49_26]PIW18766.1 MAG: hypothetical protein COW36_03450 [bacterium (Candidatus Blackallbacteria) CG17_big_fil_post_rev_8_21_14_2_50_48_46]PIW49453.1 MAG: hypothetical protein COW20_05815 [bacterium (Candidatus Blackallbacteria) CG13_big_fil_rev_8_21_14_2_50_49_14]
MQNCINYKWPIEQADNLAELESLVERMLAQYELEYFRVLYPDLNWEELGEFLSEELDDDEQIDTVAYWLELAQRKLNLLLIH